MNHQSCVCLQCKNIQSPQINNLRTNGCPQNTIIGCPTGCPNGTTIVANDLGTLPRPTENQIIIGVIIFVVVIFILIILFGAIYMGSRGSKESSPGTVKVVRTTS